jgi:hypothetical protein
MCVYMCVRVCVCVCVREREREREREIAPAYAWACVPVCKSLPKAILNSFHLPAL